MTIPREKIISDESYIISRSDDPSVLLFHRIDGKVIESHDLYLLKRLYNEMRVTDIIMPYENLTLTDDYLLSYAPDSSRYVRIFLQVKPEEGSPKDEESKSDRDKVQITVGKPKNISKKFGIISRLLHKNI